MGRIGGLRRLHIAAGGFAALALVACAGLIGLVCQKVTSTHHRPHGHQDISFDVSPVDDLLVFNASGDGGRDLYVLDLRRRGIRRLAKTPEYETAPSFSPDGKSVVYAAGVPGDRADHIVVRPLDGGPARQLTSDDQNDRDPHFSPDGRQIVFARNPMYAWGGLAASWNGTVLYMMRSDGTDLRSLTDPNEYAGAPRFSPTGEVILFRGMDGLLTMAPDGRRRATPLLRDRTVGNAAFSPDGKHIAFSRGRYASQCEIHLMNADGTNVRQLTRQGGCFHPVFTRDGKSIIYFVESWNDGPTGAPTYSLWRIDADGENPVMLAGSELFEDPMSRRL